MTVELSPEQSEIPTPRMLSWARNSTIYRLQRQMLTEKQLSDAIARKAKEKFDGISPAQIKALVELAVKFGYDNKALDDVAYAEIATRSSVRSGRSRRAIAQRLAIKGIDRETASVALEATDDLYAAVVFARKRAFGPFRRGDLDDKRKAKELSAFARGGFGFELGKRVFEMAPDEADEILSVQPMF
ncbi:recombination regulator RecX [Rhizobium sp. LjRoot254]|uniref:recombination regulator RecX n=1 Tax=Rhizobium sp. LjRoot254 TaxID=3342297 RepID=UPI003F4FBB7D